MLCNLDYVNLLSIECIVRYTAFVLCKLNTAVQIILNSTLHTPLSTLRKMSQKEPSPLTQYTSGLLPKTLTEVEATDTPPLR